MPPFRRRCLVCIKLSRNGGKPKDINSITKGAALYARLLLLLQNFEPCLNLLSCFALRSSSLTSCFRCRLYQKSAPQLSRLHSDCRRPPVPLHLITCVQHRTIQLMKLLADLVHLLEQLTMLISFGVLALFALSRPFARMPFCSRPAPGGTAPL